MWNEIGASLSWPDFKYETILNNRSFTCTVSKRRRTSNIRSALLFLFKMFPHQWKVFLCAFWLHVFSLKPALRGGKCWPKTHVSRMKKEWRLEFSPRNTSESVRQFCPCSLKTLFWLTAWESVTAGNICTSRRNLPQRDLMRVGFLSGAGDGEDGVTVGSRSRHWGRSESPACDGFMLPGCCPHWFLTRTCYAVVSSPLIRCVLVKAFQRGFV